MVFSGQITFSPPPPKNFGLPKIFSPPNFCFSAAFLFFGAQNQKSAFSAKEQYFSAPKRKNLFFFFFRRRLVMVFGGQITFSTPQKYFSAVFFFF